MTQKNQYSNNTQDFDNNDIAYLLKYGYVDPLTCWLGEETVNLYYSFDFLEDMVSSLG